MHDNPLLHIKIICVIISHDSFSLVDPEKAAQRTLYLCALWIGLSCHAICIYSAQYLATAEPYANTYNRQLIGGSSSGKDSLRTFSRVGGPAAATANNEETVLFGWRNVLILGIYYYGPPGSKST